MKPSQVIQSLKVCILARLPAMIWGPAGVGKSDVVAQVAKTLKLELRDVRMANLDPTDIKGFPYPDAKRGVMTWLPAEFMPTSGKGLLFFDELNLADKMTQASCYQLMLTGEVGNYKLPPGWTIVAAGNRESDRGNIVRMAGPLANRIVHLDFDADLEEWVAFAKANGVAAELVAFLRFRKELLHKFNAQAKEPAFPSPRTWVFVDRLLRQSNTPQDIQFELVRGTVGEAAAIEHRGFMQHVAELPDVAEVVANPSKAKLPTIPSAQYAIATMLGDAVTEANFTKMLTYMDRMGQQEMSVLFVRDAGNKVSAIRLTPAFRDWALRHKDIVL
jgi:MoxR-like ATPase